MADDTILETRGLTKEFKGFVAVNGVDLRVKRGELFTLRNTKYWAGPATGQPCAVCRQSISRGNECEVSIADTGAVLVITVLMNVLLFPYQHMLVVFARDVLSAGPEWR